MVEKVSFGRWLAFSVPRTHSFYPNAILSTFPYETEVKARFLIAYALLGVVASGFERISYRPQEELAKERTVQLEDAIRRLFTQIEDRKHAEAALLKSEQRFKTFSDASFEGIAFTDGDVLVDLNDQLARMLGYDCPEMIGMPVTRLCSPR